MRAFEHPVVHRYATEVTLSADFGIVETLEKPALMENLGRAGGEPDTARFPAPLSVPLEDGNTRTPKSELTREHQPRWAGADNYYISIH
jgi:hypothetical protein